MIFHQLFEKESSTYTYLLGDPATKEAILIDPVLETIERDLTLVKDLGLTLKYVLDTHVHADHVTAAGQLRERTQAKTGVSRHAKVDCADLSLSDGQELQFGPHVLRVLETPGHTDSCLSFLCEGMVFTGDALLIRGTGRTDFQQGSSEALFDSIHGTLFRLPPETKVYPAHDYKGIGHSTIAQEMKLNPRVGGGKTKADFVRIMSELKLDQPKKIGVALPANMACGRVERS
jgi:glyoxylase-like metal-dependent hydrolase (beta-lactamase superfamily II)